MYRALPKTLPTVSRIRLESLACFAAIAICCPALADVIHVPSREAPTIQAGIELANDGDTVLVAPGQYNEAINFLGRTIIVESTEGAERTIIDATGLDTSVVTIASGEAVGTELRGFTLTGGIGTESQSSMSAGGSPNTEPLLLVQTFDGSASVPLIAGESTNRTGGGLRIQNAAVLVEHCIIADNHVPFSQGSGGGGFAIFQPQGVQLRHCIIEGNTAFLGGGGVVGQGTIQVMHCVFRNNGADQGGGLNVNNNASVSLGFTTFEGNLAGHFDETMISGGGLTVLPSSSAGIISCEFIENESTGGGGGVSTSGSVTLFQTLLQENAAVRGGGVNVSGGTFNVNSSQFIENLAEGATHSGGGGGLHVEIFNAVVTLSNSSFIGNVAGTAGLASGGGAARLRRAVTINNCTFENNHSSSTGGALDVELIEGQPISIKDSTFTNNSADSSGGGLIMWSSGINTMHGEIINCHFEGNVAQTNGGGASLFGPGLDVTIEASTFIENSAVESGGGLNLGKSLASFAPEGDPTVTDCIFIGNVANAGGGVASSGNHSQATFSNCVFEDNSAELGGGVVVFSNGSSAGPSQQFQNCTFVGNSALQGGGINFNSLGRAELTDCIFNANSATGSGGAASISSSAIAGMLHCEFTANSANNGGAISTFGGLSTRIRACTFNDNVATANGGAIVSHATYRAEHSSFTNNTAGELGGALAVLGGSPVLTSLELTANIAGVEGGAIYSAGDPQLEAVIACANSPDNIAGDFTDLANNLIDESCHAGVVLDVPADFATIQLAIDAAIHGDEIRVAPGSYNEAIDFSGKRLVVRSSDGPHVTTIDATGWADSAVTVTSFEGAGTTLRGFTITGGSGEDGDGIGGGVRTNGAMLLIDDCIITGNSASLGGGISVTSGSVHGALTITNCRIVENHANFGGGVRNTGTLNILATTIDSNVASSSVGGLFAMSGVTTCTECEFRNNSAPSIGAVGFHPNGTFLSADSLYCGNSPGDIEGFNTSIPWTGDQGGNVFEEECPPEPIVGDLNGDGVVDVSDLLILLGAWGSCSGDCPADLNGDGNVNTSDLLILLANWG